VKVGLKKEGEFPDFAWMLRSFPRLNARILGYIGKEAALELYTEHLQGQDLTLHKVTRSSSGLPYGKSGRRLVTYSIGRGLRWVAVSSFPLNLFEGGRRLRSGVQEEPKRILRGKLKQDFSGRLRAVIAAAEELIVDDWFNAEKKGGLRGL
jgi:hypothetical protein